MSELLNHIRDVMRKKHYSVHTENAYTDWIKRYIIYHGKRHPGEMGESEIAQFLTHLARDRNVAAGTQNQALNALVFLYKNVLKIELGNFGHIERSKKPKNLPEVMSREEVSAVLSSMKGKHLLMAKLLYGCGLRIKECVRLRVKDIDFGQNHLMVRDGKGMKDRTTMLPDQLKPLLHNQLKKVEKFISRIFGTEWAKFTCLLHWKKISQCGKRTDMEVYFPLGPYRKGSSQR
ncbi:phage integrase N-terminal SAM-like domain-containing protein [Desulfonema magnum]|uniref:Integron integrase n=1 Tax=Desulfonema magnum TaxID=45655 RepID=A0A975BUF5_9BACT|nr:phage integrase N-terminal SAM-like domain-containing protein [Desulfonema magnum]QTA91345.1 Integron integrase [Desulfonema magnum]